MKNRIILAVAAVLVLAVGLAAMSHNSEDSFCIPLTAPIIKYVSLPYNNSYTSAKQVRDDIYLITGSASRTTRTTGR